MSIHSLTVTPEEIKSRIDVYLTANLPDAPSRSYVQKLIVAGCVTVDGKVIKSNYKVEDGDKLEVTIPKDFLRQDHIEAENIPLNIVYEDDFLIVINKPCGMVVHPAAGNYSGTLVNALLHYTKSLSDLNSEVRPGIVHRLDQETSGLILIAKDNKTHAKLSAQFQDHKVKKRYVALVEGGVQFDEGQINEPLGRHPKHREKQQVSQSDDAREAITFYKVIKRFKNITYIALFPKTGRTHQLRVHMAYLHHSILGDEKYGKKVTFPRLALHAQSIGFTHPGTKRYIEFSIRPPVEFLRAVGLA